MLVYPKAVFWAQFLAHFGSVRMGLICMALHPCLGFIFFSRKE